ncbi:MAG: hypothetical protein NVS3B1_12590 [Marmoricola sp.]
MPEEVKLRKGREGARWINERPTSEDFGAWFHDNVKVDPALDAKDYVGGIVLIPAVDEKAKHVTGFAANGAPIIQQRAEMAYIPYAKVETRIQYFWDLMEAHSEEWIGVIEPIITERPEMSPISEIISTTDAEGRLVTTTNYRQPANAAIVQQLPPGFFLLPMPLGQAYTHFLCCAYRVAVYERASFGDGGPIRDAHPIREGRGTKMVPLLLGRDTKYPDVNAIMKAETGAVGRAIGFAGIFNIPGSGVATAEDMLEALAQAPAATSDASTDVAAEGGAGPQAPAQEPVRTLGEVQAATDADLQAQVNAMAATLKERFPDAWVEFGKWCHERKPAITSLAQTGPALRGLARKLEKSLQTAQEAVASTPTERSKDEEQNTTPADDDGRRSGEPVPDVGAQSGGGDA